MSLLRVISICFLVALLTVTARAYVFQEKDSVWQAVVRVDSTLLYSGPSTNTRQVRLLKRGDIVSIGLEITKEDGKWYSVSLSGQTSDSGYLAGKDLEVGQQANVAIWEFTPPPEPVIEVAKAEPVKKPIRKVAFTETNGKINIDIKSFFLSKFGTSLPISAFGQTALHNRLRFDHRNAIDVAVHPDSLQGQLLINALHKFGVPFIAFRSAVRGSATGPHIHIGMPSHRK